MKAYLGSLFYRWFRSRTIKKTYAKQKKEGRARDLEEVVEIGDRILKKIPKWLYSFKIPKGIGVQLYDLYFPSPLTLSAFKEDLDIIGIYLQLGLGGACTKTIMAEQRSGNKRPRLQEAKYEGQNGLINAMGLPGKSIEDKICEIQNSSIHSYKKPICFSIGGTSLEEYKSNFDKLNKYLASEFKSQFYYEINISCPNTPEGQQMAKHPQLLTELLEYMISKTYAVVGVKLSPDFTNEQLVSFAKLAKEFSRIYVNLGNTRYRKCEQVGLRADAISIGGGGESGPALYERTLEMVKLLSPHGIPIIATGGVDSAEKVLELQQAGATLVGMATAVVKDIYCIPKINYELAKNSRG